MSSPTIHQILRHYWKFDTFRSSQEEIIQSVISGNDTLALLPTGGGKSICFQVPGLYLSGVTLVISPLIALMKDQVENLRKRGIAAVSIHSGMTLREVDQTLDNCIFGKTKFLYVSPERLKSELFITRLQKMKISLLAIDESHCISQWGYDFRPSYLEIAQIREILPDVPVLALTATATPEVVDDIMVQLKFRKKNVIQKSFYRSNLVYSVRKSDHKPTDLVRLLEQYPGTAVVYTRNRKRTKQIAEWIQSKGISADYYHAGLSSEDRSRKQDEWIKDKIRVIVATNAFGMGIDKPDVRLVVHLDIPDSLEAYFQEAGRGGRDEKTAYAFTLFHNADLLQLEEQFQKSYPPLDEIKRIYNALFDHLNLAQGSGKNQNFVFEPLDFCQKFKIDLVVMISALSFLEKLGFLTFSDVQDTYSKIQVLYTPRYEQLSDKQTALLQYVFRSQAGVMDQPQQFKERYMALKLQWTEAETIHVLKHLQAIGQIAYYPARSGFSVTFLEERLHSKNFRIPPEIYEVRKKVARAKLDAILYFFQSDSVCRSRILLNYFGENSEIACGKCDACLKKNPGTNSSVREHQILEILAGRNQKMYPLKEFHDMIPWEWGPRAAFVRQLADRKFIRVNESMQVMVDLERVKKHV